MKNFENYLNDLMESRDELSLHSEEVSELGHNFGAYLGLGLRDIKNLKIGGLIHDIGKLKVDETILFKTEHLTDEEFKKIKEHPVLGYELLLNTSDKFSKDVLDIVLQHHERIDGKGYPNQLFGNEINSLAKIISLCDVYSAITSSRSYKEGKDDNYALSEIEKELGTAFDIELGTQFIGFIKKTKLNHKTQEAL